MRARISGSLAQTRAAASASAFDSVALCVTAETAAAKPDLLWTMVQNAAVSAIRNKLANLVQPHLGRNEESEFFLDCDWINIR